MISRSARSCSCVLLVTLACADDGGSEVGDEAGTTDADSTDADSTDADSTDADSTDADSTDTGTGECTPEGTAAVTFDLLDVDLLEVDPGQSLDWAATCTVAEASPGTIGLVECTELGPGRMPVPTELGLVFTSSPNAEPLIAAGDRVQLHWVQEPPFYAGSWFTLRDESGQTLLLAGLDGPSVLPPAAPSFGFAPVDVAYVGSECETFDANGCATGQRGGLELGWDGVTTVIADSNAGFVGQLVSYRGIVDAAIGYSEIVCDDFASANLVALIVLIPEG